MAQTFTRQQLYELVWSEPMQTLAGRFELSDVGLSKACKKANIPRPPRGYWAKRAAGKKISRIALPPRGPGMAQEVEIGGGRQSYYRHYTEQEILDADPQPPVFDEPIEDVAARVDMMVPRVTVPSLKDRAHNQVRRLLDADEQRRQKQAAERYSYSWNEPLFDDPFEQRRLRVLSAIMTALERAGMKPSVSGRDARRLDVRIGDTLVFYTLDAASQKSDPYGQDSIATRGNSTVLKLAVTSCPAAASWEDNGKSKLESRLTEIVRAMIICGERQYRQGREAHYEWLVKRKTALLEEVRQRKAQAAREERERQQALEQARVDRLLADAAAYRQAVDIRAFVAEVEKRFAAGEVRITEEQLQAWRTWALERAERVDPVRSGRFLNEAGG